jgi:hypothetical protein
VKSDVHVLPAEQFETTRTALYSRLAVPEDTPDFYAEWSSVREQLDHTLNAFHTSDDPMPNYILSDEWSYQRQQAMGIYRLPIFCREFVLAVQQVLGPLPHLWLVDVACECYDTPPDIPWGEVIITADGLYTDDERLSKELNVPRQLRIRANA